MPDKNFSVTVWDEQIQEYQPLKRVEKVDFNRLISSFNVSRVKIILEGGNIIIVDKIGQNVDTYA
jgi:hypothetical protein